MPVLIKTFFAKVSADTKGGEEAARNLDIMMAQQLPGVNIIPPVTNTCHCYPDCDLWVRSVAYEPKKELH